MQYLWEKTKSIASAVGYFLWENKIPIGTTVITTLASTERGSLVAYFARETLLRTTQAATSSTVVSVVGMAASSYVIFRTRYQPVKNILSGISNNPDQTSFSDLTPTQKIISVIIIGCGTHSMSMNFLVMHESFIKTVKGGLYLLGVIAEPLAFSWKKDWGYFAGLLTFGLPVGVTIIGYGFNFFVSNSYAAAQFVTSSEFRARKLEGVSRSALVVVSAGSALYLLPASGFAYLSYSDMFNTLFNMGKNPFFWFTTGCGVMANTLTFPGQGFRLLGKKQEEVKAWFGTSGGRRLGFFATAAVLSVDTAIVSIANTSDFHDLSTSWILAIVMASTAGAFHIVFNLPVFNRPPEPECYLPTRTTPILGEPERGEEEATLRLV